MFEISIMSGGICALAALTGGFIDAIAGGGGLLTIPALLLVGVPPHLALGVNKISSSSGTAVALFNFARHGLVNWRTAFFGIPFSLVGSWLGAWLALEVDSALLGKILVALLPFAMLATLMPQKERANREVSLSSLRFRIVLPIVCCAIGFYDGFFGPGTGIFLILALHWILRQNLIEASATAKAFNLASNVSAAISFIWHGSVLWPLALLMAFCFIIGNWAGSAMAIRVGAGAVRKFLIVSMLLLLVTLVWRFFLAA